MVTKSKTSAQTEVEAPTYSDWKLAGVLAAALFLARAVYLAFICPYALGPDEAQYWSWSSHLDWSFATKPPLTTYLAGLATYVGGQTDFAVRFFALIAQTATLLLGFALARRLGQTLKGNHERAAGWWAFALLATAPAIGFAGLFMAPDSLLVPLYLAALLLLAKETAHATPDSKNWLTIGALVGLAGLAKYSAVFFYPLAGLYALLWRRDWLVQPWFYVSGLVALALQAPVLYWNFAHHLQGFHHVAWQLDAGDDRHGNLLTTLNFIAGQAGYFGPLVLGLMIAALGAALLHHRRLPAAHRLLVVFIVPLLGFFLAQTLFSKVQPNWPILATVPALILLAAWLPAQNSFVRQTAGVGVALNTVLVIILSHTLAFGVPTLIKPLREMLGVHEVATMTQHILSKLEPGTAVLTTNYGTMARHSFYLPHTTVLYLNPGDARVTQYDAWPWPSLEKRLTLVVMEGANRALPATVTAKFANCHYVTSTQIAYKQKPLREAAYYLCGGAK